jgi:hypothetical protein
VKRLLQSLAHAFGVEVRRYPAAPLRPSFPPDVTTSERAILTRIAPFTMTSVERQLALIRAVRHVVHAGIAGAVVECGVWRGGSSMAAALTLRQEGRTDRDLYLYDTFSGMTAPTDADRTAEGELAREMMARDDSPGGVRAIAGIEDVRANMAATGYPAARLHFVAGAVEQTIPAQAPAGPIALLRLDTDWYESTKHELTHLFPRLVEGGVLIIDDYGHWDGARRAVDDYLAGLPKRYLLSRIDYTGRMIVK